MKKFLVTTASFALPGLVFAQSVDTGYIDSILESIGNIISTLLPLIIAGAVVYFVWNIARYVVAGDDAAKEQYKDRIIYGIIGLFVMVAVWGLVNLLSGILGVDTGGQVDVPQLPNL